MTSPRVAATVGEWFTSIEPAPPQALAGQLTLLIADDASRPVSDVPEVCLRIAEEHLQRLLASGATSRASAIDLLAVDALVTYAFEAAASDASKIEARTIVAMQRIGALAGEAHNA